jgi:hypothetical protein
LKENGNQALKCLISKLLSNMAKIRVANHGKHETVVFTCGPPLNMDEIDIKIQYYSTDHNQIKQFRNCRACACNAKYYPPHRLYLVNLMPKLYKFPGGDQQVNGACLGLWASVCMYVCLGELRLPWVCVCILLVCLALLVCLDRRAALTKVPAGTTVEVELYSSCVQLAGCKSPASVCVLIVA